MKAFDQEEPIELEYASSHIAIIRLNRPKKLNALSYEALGRLATLMRSVSDNPKVIATILTGNGKFFSAGADVDAANEMNEKGGDLSRLDYLKRASVPNLELPAAFYEHRPILIAALNGPAVGIAAALLGHCDFIHAVESAYIFCPFSALGLAAEGGSSASFVSRMGVSKAKEALILGKKITVPALAHSGFVNKVYPDQQAPAFHSAVVAYFTDRLDGLDPKSVITIKQLINKSLPEPALASSRELQAIADVFTEGRPQVEFGKFARREKRHKL